MMKTSRKPSAVRHPCSPECTRTHYGYGVLGGLRFFLEGPEHNKKNESELQIPVFLNE